MANYIKVFIVLILIGIGAYAVGYPDTTDDPIVKIFISNPSEIQSLNSLGIDIWEIHPDYLIARINQRQSKQITKLGIKFETRFASGAEYLQYLKVPFHQLQDNSGAYHNYDETTAEMYQWAALYPSICTVFSIGTSIEGRPLVMAKISSNPLTETQKPRILLMGCHHAREWISVEVPFFFGKNLLANYSTDSLSHRLVNDAQTYIIPIMNPDGLYYSQNSDRLWRKNRRNLGAGYYGVDLNRNYGSHWGGEGASSYLGDETYCGSSAFSEPETQFIRDWTLSHFMTASISFHSYGQEILYPWSYTTDTVAPHDRLFYGWGTTMLGAILREGGVNYLVQQSSYLYPVGGDSDDWLYVTQTCMPFTIELRPEYDYQGGFILPEDQIQPTVTEMDAAIKTYMQSIIYRPQVDFYATPTSGAIPLTVQFHDSSSNSPTSWIWSFGDGGTSTTQNPSHQYQSAGQYSVTLIISNSYGNSTSTKTGYIQANPPGPFTGNISNPIAIPSYGGVKLSWVNPNLSNYGATLIVSRTDRFPLSPTDGTLIYWYNGTQCNVAGVNGRKYYFGIFAHDKSLNFAPGVFISATPNSYENIQNLSEATPFSGSVQFQWSNPTVTTTYDATILIRRGDRWPLDPADGYNPSDSSWYRYWYNGSQFGETIPSINSTYYYGLYANDSDMNFSPGILIAHKDNPVLGNVQNLNIKPGFKSVQFNWANPSTSNYLATLFVRNGDHYPSNPMDGVIAYWSDGTSFVDYNLVEGKKNYYAIYPSSSGLDFAPGIAAAVIPGNYQNITGLNAITGSGSVTLNWINPNRLDYQSTLITRRTDRMPTDPSDYSTISYWSNGTTFSESGLTTGQTYYYTLYSQNKEGAFSPGVGMAVTP